MDALVRDVRHAFRLLSSNRGFAAAALTTIALGVGGTAAVFSVVYGVLLPITRPLLRARSCCSRWRVARAGSLHDERRPSILLTRFERSESSATERV